MEGAWFTELADELARCLTDAEVCADACEELLNAVRAQQDTELQRRAVSALVAPAAISRVLIDLIDHPPQLVLAACRLCRDSARTAIRELEPLHERLDTSAALPALEALERSCRILLDAA
jgi:hypothetical protein